MIEKLTTGLKLSSEVPPQREYNPELLDVLNLAVFPISYFFMLYTDLDPTGFLSLWNRAKCLPYVFTSLHPWLFPLYSETSLLVEIFWYLIYSELEIVIDKVDGELLLLVSLSTWLPIILLNIYLGERLNKVGSYKILFLLQ